MNNLYPEQHVLPAAMLCVTYVRAGLEPLPLGGTLAPSLRGAGQGGPCGRRGEGTTRSSHVWWYAGWLTSTVLTARPYGCGSKPASTAPSPCRHHNVEWIADGAAKFITTPRRSPSMLVVRPCSAPAQLWLQVAPFRLKVSS